MNKKYLLIKTCVAIIAFLSFLSGCGIAQKNIKDDIEVKENNGILLTTLHSNYTGYESFFHTNLNIIYQKEGDSIITKKLGMNQADDLKIIELPAGRYYWRSLNIEGFYFDLNGFFNINSNSITYIGDIYIYLEKKKSNFIGTAIYGPQITANMLVKDNKDETMVKLKELYPKLLNTYQVKQEMTNFISK